jgi:hypothetical protein
MPISKQRIAMLKARPRHRHAEAAHNWILTDGHWEEVDNVVAALEGGIVDQVEDIDNDNENDPDIEYFEANVNDMGGVCFLLGCW